jgi:CheY-like chemotaxis protein
MSEAKRILVVDDEQDVREYLSALLEDAGYRVTTAEHGEQALAEVRKEAPDLVSVDIRMPEKTGVRFYREMREDPRLAKIPIVIVTGVSNPWQSPDGTGSLERFLSTRKRLAPPDGFFEKPLEQEAYLAKIAELLA